MAKNALTNWEDAKYLLYMRDVYDHPDTDDALKTQIESEVVNDFGLNINQFANVPIQHVMSNASINSAHAADLIAGTRSQRR